MNRGVCISYVRAFRWVVYLFLIHTPLISAYSAVPDTIPVIITDDAFYYFGDSLISAPQDTLAMPVEKIITKAKDPFTPNPKTARNMAFIFPGAGQFYNRQYWKLPIVYGGFMGCAYAISWNNRTYQDYKNAYYSIVRDAEAARQETPPENWNENWTVFVPGGRDPDSYLNNSSFRSSLKRGKDYFRRYRDLSIIITAGVYLICVADAFVDAQMFDFDVSPDLSFHVTPLITPANFYQSRTYGFNVCMTF